MFRAYGHLLAARDEKFSSDRRFSLFSFLFKRMY